MSELTTEDVEAIVHRALWRERTRFAVALTRVVPAASSRPAGHPSTADDAVHAVRTALERECAAVADCDVDAVMAAEIDARLARVREAWPAEAPPVVRFVHGPDCDGPAPGWRVVVVVTDAAADALCGGLKRPEVAARWAALRRGENAIVAALQPLTGWVRVAVRGAREQSADEAGGSAAPPSTSIYDDPPVRLSDADLDALIERSRVADDGDEAPR